MAREILMRAALPARAGAVQADIVLLRLTHNDVTPWVTWQMNLGTVPNDTYWGHYHRDSQEAVDEFFARAKRKGAIVYEEGKRPW